MTQTVDRSVTVATFLLADTTSPRLTKRSVNVPLIGADMGRSALTWLGEFRESTFCLGRPSTSNLSLTAAVSASILRTFVRYWSSSLFLAGSIARSFLAREKRFSDSVKFAFAVSYSVVTRSCCFWLTAPILTSFSDLSKLLRLSASIASAALRVAVVRSSSFRLSSEMSLSCAARL